MFEAQRQWVDRQGTFATAFRYQYVLSPEVEDIHSFRHHRIKDWHAHCGTALPFCRLKDAKGRDIGVLLGIAVGPDGLLSDRASFVPMDSTAPTFWDDFERYLVDVAGRYAFVMECAGEARLYCDPVGMIGVVYNRDDRYVAASPLLTLKRPVQPNPKFDFDMIEHHGGKLTLFHTADTHVKRLKPNHFLNLATFEEHRFWPRDEDFTAPIKDTLALYDEISARAAFNIGEIAASYQTAMPVSGGQDSRLILAFGRQHLDKVGQFYTHINNYATRRDDAIAQELCRALNVPHETHDRRVLTLPKWEVKKSQRTFHLTMGVKAKLPEEYVNGVITGVQDGAVVMRGHQTDLLRAVYVFRPKNRWHEPDWQIERLLIVPRHLFDQEVADRFRPDFEAWQATLPDNAREKAADFMFLEVYYNATVGATFPALWRNFYVSPYNSRRLIALSLMFGEHARRKSWPVFDLIERTCPDLSPIPFDFEIPASLDGINDEEYRNHLTLRRRRRTRRRFARYRAEPVGT